MKKEKKYNFHTEKSLYGKAGKWIKEFEELRNIILTTGLNEDLKWGYPCFTLDGKNVVLIHGFKEYCALLFFKGRLMKDPAGILIRQTANVQSARQIRFLNLNQIVKSKANLIKYLNEAIQIEKAGLKIPLKKSADYTVPEEFQRRLSKSARLRSAFEKLTPGRQRGYLLYFTAPKQSITREARIDRSIIKIMNGLGLNDSL